MIRLEAFTWTLAIGAATMVGFSLPAQAVEFV
jgi:hypothetical protein